jgi:hypothetical protein
VIKTDEQHTAARMDSSEYYWLPWLYTYQKLQAATRTGTAGFDKDLKQVQQWLQDGAARFKPPSEQSAAALKKGGNLKATAYGPGKGFAVDKQLVQATLELSQLLVGVGAVGLGGQMEVASAGKDGNMCGALRASQPSSSQSLSQLLLNKQLHGSTECSHSTLLQHMASCCVLYTRHMCYIYSRSPAVLPRAWMSFRRTCYSNG